MSRLHSRVLPGAWFAVGLWACCSNLQAQDSFDNSKVPASRTPQQTQAPAPLPPGTPQRPDRSGGTAAENARRPGDAGESQDFGVKPISQLRPTEQLHGPTPTTIPGGKIVGTQQLAQWMQGQQGQQGRVMLLHAIASDAHLPNAIPAVPASQGGAFDDQVQRDFGEYLKKATGGDRSRLLVTYCQGIQCWGSYNAALRAIHMGYTNVHWYRGGMEAWHRAGLPLLNASAQNGSPSPREASAPR
jgi:PQQ-dependent catabolism-associated CXXCW motif protein